MNYFTNLITWFLVNGFQVLFSPLMQNKESKESDQQYKPTETEMLLYQMLLF